MQIRKLFRLGLLAASLISLFSLNGYAQTANPAVAPAEQPDAERTKNDLSQLLDHYPPSLRNVLALDPGLLTNQSYLTPYPALAAFLTAHPEIIHNPSFYISPNVARPHTEQLLDFWRDILAGFGLFLGFCTAAGLIIWLIRTLVDYRRWNRLTKVQTDAHTKLLDRFASNEDLLAYIQSPAGAKFLESSPISLEASPRNVSAPLGRILWSLQAGLVVAAVGIGLDIVSNRITEDAVQPLRALGVLGVALGIGFVISAVVSYLISRRLGLIETPTARSTVASARQ
jgi:hypothetical protein